MKKYQIQISGCHRMPERSFFWKGRQFPVCARCTGYHIGYLTAPFFLFGLFALNFWITLALLVPSYLDGFSQAFGLRESNNWLRITTGLMSGVAWMSLVSILGKWTGDQILRYISF